MPWGKCHALTLSAIGRYISCTCTNVAGQNIIIIDGVLFESGSLIYTKMNLVQMFVPNCVHLNDTSSQLDQRLTDVYA